MKMGQFYFFFGSFIFLSQGTAHALNCRKLFEDHFHLPIDISHRSVMKIPNRLSHSKLNEVKELLTQGAEWEVLRKLVNRGYTQTVLPGSKVRVVVFNLLASADWTWWSSLSFIPAMAGRYRLSQHSAHEGEFRSWGSAEPDGDGQVVNYVEIRLADGTISQVQAAEISQVIYMKVID